MTKIYEGNLIINFTLKGEDYVEDPETGNPMAVEIPYKVKAHVKGIPNILGELGSNPNVVNIEGKIVETWNNLENKWEHIKVLPEALLRFQSEANAIYVDPSSGFEQICYFTLAPDIDARRSRVARRLAKRLGSDIKGTLRF